MYLEEVPGTGRNDSECETTTTATKHYTHLRGANDGSPWMLQRVVGYLEGLRPKAQLLRDWACRRPPHEQGGPHVDEE